MTDTGHTTNQFDSQDTQRYDELMRSINDELEKLENRRRVRTVIQGDSEQRQKHYPRDCLPRFAG